MEPTDPTLKHLEDTLREIIEREPNKALEIKTMKELDHLLEWLRKSIEEDEAEAEAE